LSIDARAGRVWGLTPLPIPNENSHCQRLEIARFDFFGISRCQLATPITFRWEEIIQAVRRMTNPFKEFLLKVVSLQFKTLNLTVSKGSAVW